MGRQQSHTWQSARRAALDTIRLHRALTPAEQAEADNLAQRLYMREWRRSFGQIGTRTPNPGKSNPGTNHAR